MRDGGIVEGAAADRAGAGGGRGVYPGSFNPLTIAHLAVAEAAQRTFGLARLDLVVSVAPLGKDDAGLLPLDERRAVLEAAGVARPWLGVTVSRHRLLVDLAEGADVLVVGADKWAQLHDPAWYGSVAARDEALARLPVVAVAPRPPHPSPAPAPRVVPLDVDPAVWAVSASQVRAGRFDWAAPEAAALVDRLGPPPEA